MKLAPITLFVYKRLWHTRQTVEALQRNDLAAKSELFIYSDGPKSEADKEAVANVREYVKSIAGFKHVSVIKRERNLGLAKSIICGASEVIKDAGKIIVLEDDIVTAKVFLRFMNNALEHYQSDIRIFTVSGYSYPIRIPNDYPYPVYLAYRGSPWGWATWRDRWEMIDWEVRDLDQFRRDRIAQNRFKRGGDDLPEMLFASVEERIDAWSIRRTYTQFRKDAYTLHPTISKVRNIGCDGSGTHCGIISNVDVQLDAGEKDTGFPKQLDVNDEINKRIRKLFRYSLKDKIYLLISKYSKRMMSYSNDKLRNIISYIKWNIQKIILKSKGIVFVEPNYLYFDNFDDTSVIVDVGCGYDADFSVYMIKKYNLRAYVVDPTEKHFYSLRKLEEKYPDRVIHLKIAVAAKSGKMTFNESFENVSGSILNDHNNVINDSIKSYQVEAVTLRDLFERTNNDIVDYLKLDIEGAEYELLSNVTAEDLAPYKQIFIEFHHHCISSKSKKDTIRIVKLLQDLGLRYFSLDNHNYLFIR